MTLSGNSVRRTNRCELKVAFVFDVKYSLRIRSNVISPLDLLKGYWFFWLKVTYIYTICRVFCILPLETDQEKLPKFKNLSMVAEWCCGQSSVVSPFTSCEFRTSYNKLI